MSLIRKVQLADGDGNYFKSFQATDGDHYLGSSTIQTIFIDTNNSSTTNLTSANSYTFTGAGTSTLGFSGLQWSLKTDQKATVYIEQSPDNINWDISDSFDYFPSKGGNGETVQSVHPYWRIRVVLPESIDTTYFRLQGRLYPIVDPMPRSLDSYGKLKTTAGLQDAETGKRAEIESLGSLKTTSPVRLIGESFDGTIKDPNFWTETTTGSGSVTQDGQITLTTGTTSDSSVYYDSLSKARKITGTTNQFRGIGRLVTEPEANNLRRIGCYDDNDGFFFQINGTTFGVGSRKGTIDTIINSGSFNGNYGENVIVDTLLRRFVISYTSLSAKFFIDDILLHTISDQEATTNSLTLPIRLENTNSNGNTTNHSFQIRLATILRLGDLYTNSTFKYISGETTNVLKYGAGILHTIINNNNSGEIIIYDNTEASGDIIANIDLNKVFGDFNFNTSFSNGLTVVTSGVGTRVSITYE